MGGLFSGTYCRYFYPFLHRKCVQWAAGNPQRLLPLKTALDQVPVLLFSSVVLLGSRPLTDADTVVKDVLKV
jgi:hypothetical protein